MASFNVLGLEELKHQPINRRRIFIGRPVPCVGNPVQVEMTYHGTDLTNHIVGSTKRRIIPFAPQNSKPSVDLGQIA